MDEIINNYRLIYPSAQAFLNEVPGIITSIVLPLAYFYFYNLTIKSSDGVYKDCFQLIFAVVTLPEIYNSEMNSAQTQQEPQPLSSTTATSNGKSLQQLLNDKLVWIFTFYMLKHYLAVIKLNTRNSETIAKF